MKFMLLYNPNINFIMVISLVSLIILMLIAFSLTLQAHQPVLDDRKTNTKEHPFIIEKPEIPKAIFSILKDKPHFYLLESMTIFSFM